MSASSVRQLAAQASGSQRDVAHLIREEAPGCWPPADLPVLLSGRKAGSTCAESELSTSSHHDVDMQSPTAAAEGVPPRPPLRSDPSTADSWQAGQRSKQSSALPPPVRCTSRWQSGYWASALALEACLNLPWCSQKELLSAIKLAQTSLFSHIRESTTALEQGLVHETLSGMQFLPQQRVLLWCGGLRPSDLLCWARIALSATQQDLAPSVSQALDALQASCRQQQDRLGSGVEQLSERLARSGAIMRFVCRQRSQTAAPVTTPVDGCVAMGLRSHCTGILEGMALMLMQADELRIRCLEHLATILTPRQYAYVLIAPCDILQLV